MSGPALLYPEDLEVGRSLALGSWLVTEEQMVAFASTWDPQPFHLSAEAGARTSFGGLIASGVHTQAVFQRLSALAFFTRAAIIAGRGMRSLELPKPVRPETTLTGELTFEEVVLRERGRADIALRGTLRDDGGDLVFVMCGDLVMARRPDGPLSDRPAEGGGGA